MFKNLSLLCITYLKILFCVTGLPAEVYDEIEQPDIKLLFKKTMEVRQA